MLEHVEESFLGPKPSASESSPERLQSFRSPRGWGDKLSRHDQGPSGDCSGADPLISDAARALVGAMQRVSIHDTELTAEIAKLEKSVPLRVRNGDARLIEASANEVKESAKAARYRVNKSTEVALTLLSSLEASLGQALEVTASLEQEVAGIRILLAELDDPDTFIQKRAALTAAVQRLDDGVKLGRARSRSRCCTSERGGASSRPEGERGWTVGFYVDGWIDPAGRPQCLLDRAPARAGRGAHLGEHADLHASERRRHEENQQTFTPRPVMTSCARSAPQSSSSFGLKTSSRAWGVTTSPHCSPLPVRVKPPAPLRGSCRRCRR